MYGYFDNETLSRRDSLVLKLLVWLMIIALAGIVAGIVLAVVRAALYICILVCILALIIGFAAMWAYHTTRARIDRDRLRRQDRNSENKEL